MDKKLEGMTFVITGILEGYTRNEIESFIERHGGKMGGSVSSKTDYLVIGDKPGASKLSKAQQFKTKTLKLKKLIELTYNGKWIDL